MGLPPTGLYTLSWTHGQTPRLLYRAVYNLAENAIKYNHSGGKVTVKILASSEQGSTIALIIPNTDSMMSELN